jgi:chaperonin cofactor prefoldin
MKSKQNERIDELAKSTYKSLDKLEQRITTLEKVIGKLQLRLADMTWWIDNKLEKKVEQNVSK